MGVKDDTQIKITVPDNWNNIEGKTNPDPSPDDSGQKKETPASPDDKGAEKTLPFDQHPKWKAARQSQKELNEIMAKVGASDIEELQELIDKSASVLDRYDGIDIEAKIKAADEFERTKAYLAEQEAKKREAEETFEETIERLKREKRELQEGVKSKTEQEKEAKQAQRVLQTFTKTVESSINTSEDLPDEYRPFAKLLMGIGNPANEIDINNKAEVKKMTNDLTKVVKDFEQAVIKRYRGGKAETPPMSSSAENPSEGRKPVKNIRDATARIKEMLKVS